MRAFARSSVIASLVVCWAASSARAQETAAVAVQQGGDVVVIRGLLGYWPGCSTFKTQLREHGLRPWVHPTVVPVVLARQIAHHRAKGTMSGTLCIVGYSLGADLAIQTARHLEGMGVVVDRLVLIEPTVPGKIPSNVRYCFNLYESRPMTDWLPAFRGVQVQPTHPGTPVVNYDVGKSDGELSKRNHFTMATHARTQRVAVEQVVR